MYPNFMEWQVAYKAFNDALEMKMDTEQAIYEAIKAVKRLTKKSLFS